MLLSILRLFVGSVVELKILYTVSPDDGGGGWGVREVVPKLPATQKSIPSPEKSRI